MPLEPTKDVHFCDPLLADLGGESWAEPIPPIAHRLMVNIDFAFVEQVLYIPQRKREADIHHHCEADDLGRRLEVAENGRFHAGRVADNAVRRNERILLTGPFHQKRTVSWLTSIPRSCRRSSTFLNERGKRTYIIKASRMTSGDVLK